MRSALPVRWSAGVDLGENRSRLVHEDFQVFGSQVAGDGVPGVDDVDESPLLVELRQRRIVSGGERRRSPGQAAPGPPLGKREHDPRSPSASVFQPPASSRVASNDAEGPEAHRCGGGDAWQYDDGATAGYDAKPGRNRRPRGSRLGVSPSTASCIYPERSQDVGLVAVTCDTWQNDVVAGGNGLHTESG